MTRPHERLGMKKPLVRRLPNRYAMASAITFGAVLIMAIGFIVQVNQSAARGFILRDVEQKIENLRTEVLILEDKAARLSSVASLGQRADELGLVPVSYVKYVHAASKSYALK